MYTKFPPKLFLAALCLLSAFGLLALPPSSFAQAGSLDPSFATGGVLMTRPPLLNTTRAGGLGEIVQLSSGHLVALAPSIDDPMTFRNVLLRMTANGAVDTSFGQSGYVYIPWTTPNSGIATELGIQVISGGERLVVAGGSPCGPKSCIRFERYLLDGTLDSSFGTNGVTLVQANWSGSGDMVILPDNKILIGGGSNPLVRLNANGSPDTGFGPGGVSRQKAVVGIQTLEVLQNGKILAAGTISAGSSNNFGVARFDSAGKLDTTFGSSGKTSIDFAKMNDIAIDLAVDSVGRIVVCGEAIYTQTNPFPVGYDAVLVRLTASGQLDNSFGIGGKAPKLDIGGAQDEFTSIAIQPDGKIVLTGEGRYPGAQADVLTARYTESGFLDTTYSDDGWNLTELTGEYDTGRVAILQYDSNCSCVKLLVGAAAGTGNIGPSFQAALRYLL